MKESELQQGYYWVTRASKGYVSRMIVFYCPVDGVFVPGFETPEKLEDFRDFVSVFKERINFNHAIQAALAGRKIQRPLWDFYLVMVGDSDLKALMKSTSLAGRYEIPLFTMFDLSADDWIILP